MTEMVGYNGPIYMTQPTKALCPVLLVSECNAVTYLYLAEFWCKNILFILHRKYFFSFNFPQT